MSPGDQAFRPKDFLHARSTLILPAPILKSTRRCFAPKFKVDTLNVALSFTPRLQPGVTPGVDD